MVCSTEDTLASFSDLLCIIFYGSTEERDCDRVIHLPKVADAPLLAATANGENSMQNGSLDVNDSGQISSTALPEATDKRDQSQTDKAVQAVLLLNNVKSQSRAAFFRYYEQYLIGRLIRQRYRSLRVENHAIVALRLGSRYYLICIPPSIHILHTGSNCGFYSNCSCCSC